MVNPLLDYLYRVLLIDDSCDDPWLIRISLVDPLSPRVLDLIRRRRRFRELDWNVVYAVEMMMRCL